MKAHRTTLARLAILSSVSMAALAAGGCSDGEDGGSAVSGSKHARAATAGPVVVKLEPRHRSGISGTATLTPAGADLEVSLELSKRPSDTLMAHIHTGPCRLEPTWTNPRISASLTEVIDGRSETTVYDRTLESLRSERYAINVHAAAYPNEPIACGDLRRSS